MSTQSSKHASVISTENERFVDVSSLTTLMTDIKTEPGSISKIGKPSISFKGDSVSAIPAHVSLPPDGADWRPSPRQEEHSATRYMSTDPEHTDISTMSPDELKKFTKKLQSLLRETKHQVSEQKDGLEYAQSQIKHFMRDVKLLTDHSIAVERKWTEATNCLSRLSNTELDLYRVRHERDVLVAKNVKLLSACGSYQEAMSALVKANDDQSVAQTTWYPPPPHTSLPPPPFGYQASIPPPPPPPDYLIPAIRPQLSNPVLTQSSASGSEPSVGVYAVPGNNLCRSDR